MATLRVCWSFYLSGVNFASVDASAGSSSIEQTLQPGVSAGLVPMASVSDRLYSNLVADEESHGCRELPESACREVPGNAAKLVSGFMLQTLGDRIADPKTVLSWMLTSLGAPAFTIAMLVPIREAGSLVPQAGLIPFIRRFEYRKRAWILGSVLQGIAVLGIGLAAASLLGIAAGLVVLGVLAIFSLSRSMSSIASRDLIGKTVPRGNRGAVTGIAASVAGLATVAAGVGLAIGTEGADTLVLASLVGGASVLWFGASVVFLTIEEHPSSGEESDGRATIVESLELIKDDDPFRRFVVARILMLVTALSPPLVVSLSAQVSEAGASGVGPFVIATGVAGMVSSPVWGRLADRSSRLVMATVSGTAGLVILGFMAGRAAGLDSTIWLGPATYLLLAVAHAGARMGRKTYVVDLGRGDERTRYVAVANTVIGVALFTIGGAGAVISQLVGSVWLLGALAIAGVMGTFASVRMTEIQG